MGVPNAAMWGIFVAVLNFVPYFGPVAGVIVLATVGLLTFDTLWQGLLPPAWYLLLHLLEANLITPVLLGRRFTLNPVVIFVSLIFWTWLWGVPGALLSVLILVSIKAEPANFSKSKFSITSLLEIPTTRAFAVLGIFTANRSRFPRNRGRC
jgi:predicted PurR-regulated permease PerM